MIRPLLVSRRAGPLTICNDVVVTIETALQDCPPVPYICVPEINLPPGTPLAERYRE